LSTHGRGALGRFWLGSVADELVRRLSMPVLLVRPGEGQADLGNTPTFRRILLPLDGTPLAEKMIEPAVALGEMMDASFTLVRVIAPYTHLAYVHENMRLEKVSESILREVRAVESRLWSDARTYLDGVAAGLRSRGLRVETHVMADDQPAVGILREAENFGADLIALETHGRRGLSRVLMGSVADKVIRGGGVPVLLHRPTEE
jgi:nucleotide-binding universal stress UspA family protein